MVCEHSHLVAMAGIATGSVQTYHWLLGGLASLAEAYLISPGGEASLEATLMCRVYK